MIDKLFNNRYEIRTKLGAGGTAVVYKGYDTILGRMVTIKLLREEYSSDAELVNRFRREAQAVASLSHGNIVSVYDVGYEDKLPFIVMEYVEGETLKEYIKRKGILPVSEAVQIISQILDAVSYAHEHHIIHRDIKPQNILFAKDGRIKVTDFGIAVGLSDVTQTYNSSSKVMGSVQYISPEQVQGQPVNEKSDIYSVGVVFYEMLTGELPYTGDTAISIAMQHVQGELRIPHHINTQVPVGLSYVIMRAMRKSPDVRYASALEMKESILSVYEGVNMIYKPSSEPGNPQLEDTKELEIGGPENIPSRLAIKRPKYISKQNSESRGERTPAQKGWEEDNYEYGDSPSLARQTNPKRNAAAKNTVKKLDTKKIIILATAVLLLILIFLGGQVFKAIFASEEISVPDLFNLELEEAVNILTGKGLKYTTAFRPDAVIEANHIISQDIPPQQMVKKNRSIELIISQGPKEVEVPKLIGLSRSNAEILLSNRMLIPDISEEFDALVPIGQIIEQYPPEGSMVPEDSTVKLVISKGSKLTLVPMPNLIGKDITEAREILDSKQIFIAKLNYKESQKYAQGVVLEQSAAANTEIEQGGTVELTISEGPGPTTKNATVEYLIPNDGEEHTLRIVVEDISGSHEVYNAKLLPGTNVSEIINFQNSGKVLIYLDGAMVYAQDVE